MSTLKYPILIEPERTVTSNGVVTHYACGIIVPDLPGCFSAGDNTTEAMENAKEAIAAWIDTALDDGADIPEPSSLELLCKDPQYRGTGYAFAIVEIDTALLDDSVERVNITLPRRILARIDAKAQASGMTRSAFIAKIGLN